MHLIAKNLHKGFENALLEVMKVIKGSYALLVLFDTRLLESGTQWHKATFVWVGVKWVMSFHLNLVLWM